MKSYKLLLIISALLLGCIISAGDESIKLPDTLLQTQAQINSKIINFAPVAAKAGHYMYHHLGSA